MSGPRTTARPAAVSWWLVEAQGTGGERTARVVTLAVDGQGVRRPPLERKADELFLREPARGAFSVQERVSLVREHIEPMLHRELRHRGVVPDGGGFHAEMVGWIEIS